MKHLINIILLLSFFLQSCNSQDLQSEQNAYLGNWEEIHPVLGRTVLVFSKNQMIKKTDFNEAELSYSFIIINDTIELSSNVSDENRPIKVFFKIKEGEMLIGDFLSNDTYREILRLKKK